MQDIENSNTYHILMNANSLKFKCSLFDSHSNPRNFIALST